MKIHPLSDVKTKNIGTNTIVWQYAIIMENATIGENCNINCHTFIENDVRIGNNVTIKSGVFLWDGITVEDNVFVGPNATFTNDKFPRSKCYPETFQRTTLLKGCSIGANATVIGGLVIGSYSIIGAGSVVTKDVPAFAMICGNPGRIIGWVDKSGNKLLKIEEGKFKDKQGQYYKVEHQELIPL